jgi:hypothetical protein
LELPQHCGPTAFCVCGVISGAAELMVSAAPT